MSITNDRITEVCGMFSTAVLSELLSRQDAGEKPTKIAVSKDLFTDLIRLSERMQSIPYEAFFGLNVIWDNTLAEDEWRIE